MDGVEQGEVEAHALVIPGCGKWRPGPVGANVIQPLDVFVDRHRIGAGNAAEAAVAVETVLVQAAAVDAEYIDSVGLIAGNLNQDAGAPVLIALRVRRGGCLHDFDSRAVSEKFQR